MSYSSSIFCSSCYFSIPRMFSTTKKTTTTSLTLTFPFTRWMLGDCWQNVMFWDIMLTSPQRARFFVIKGKLGYRLPPPSPPPSPNLCICQARESSLVSVGFSDSSISAQLSIYFHTKNPTYRRQSISRPLRIVAQVPKKYFYWGKICRKTFFFAWRFYTLYEQKLSKLKPLCSITFPQGFRKSKKFGHWTLGNGGKQTVKLSEKVWYKCIEPFQN